MRKIVLSIAAIGLCSSVCVAKEKKKNVLFILVDDLQKTCINADAFRMRVSTIYYLQMKRLSILLLFCILSLSLEANDKIKVACVGNSITYGAGIINRNLNSYPAQLQSYLGDEYIVENFGVSGRTAIFKGGYSYVNTPTYKSSLEFKPDIVFIKLGTNDSNSRHLKYFDGYKSDYQTIIDSYKNLESKPRIILVTPVRCYLPAESGLSDARIVGQVTPIIEELAYENDIEIFDAYSLFGEEYKFSLMPDKLHPSSIGAGMMAANFYRLLTVDKDCSFNIYDKLKDGEEFNFHGFKGRNYNQDGFNFKVVQPKIANKKHSWVLRARFWGHEPQLDQKLLELGFHIAYCDVKNLLGANSAVKRWDDFYDIMTKAGLNQKDVGHHPHSLSSPEPILTVILKAEGLYENLCVKPIRGNEFRSAAGWRNGADWNETAADITATLKEGNIDILMLGNSITQAFAMNRKLVGSCKNNKVLNDIFKGFSWESAGMSGDKTQNLLWRVKNGEYNSANPKYVTIAIGVNNVTDDAESIYEGILAVTEAALEEFNESKIILFGMLPTAASEERFEKFHTIIDKLQDTKFDDRVLFVDPRGRFTDENGKLLKNLYSGDFIHITGEGYKVWAELIVDSINSL